MVMSSKLPEEQRNAYRLIELISSVSLITVFGLVWFSAQQSKQIDDTAKDVLEVRQDIRAIRDSVTSIHLSSVTTSAAATTISRDIDRNAREIERLWKRMADQQAYREFMDDNPRGPDTGGSDP